MSEPVVQQRLVPGAPVPLSKTQKKRRKAKKAENSDSVDIPDTTSAALVENAPQPSDIQQGSVAPELVAEPELTVDDVSLKLSPIAELINKRLKATTKKIGRIAAYAATDPSKLNDDQKATLKSLPTLEAIQKELGEVKKTIEAYEAELAHELKAQKIEAAIAEKTRIAVAVSDAQSVWAERTTDIFLLLRLRSLLTSGASDLQTSHIEEAEMTAIFGASDVLLGDNAETKQAILNGFLSRQGDFEGISYSRLVEIAPQVLNSPRAPTPEAQPTEEPVEQFSTSESTLDSQTVGGIPPSMVASTSFHFMQASEIEPSFEDNVEWVDRQDAIDPEQVESPEAAISASVNGHTSPPEEPLASATIDWAADDDEGLPSLPSLHAKFGTSGSATPVTPVGETVAEEPAVNGFDNRVSTPIEDEGFTQARGRGRGRGSRPRGGGFRGGERGGRGFRGGDFRGRGRGEWRGGEGHRGRGRGGRGGDHRGGDRGA